MIRGIHGLFYSSDPDATRAFFRDLVKLPGSDIGEGWWIFDFPEGDLGVHPVDDPKQAGGHDISFYCDDIHGTVTELKTRGVKFTKDVADHGYGLVTYFTAPGGITVQLYEPRFTKQKAGAKAAVTTKAPAKKAAAKTSAKKATVITKAAAKTSAKKATVTTRDAAVQGRDKGGKAADRAPMGSASPRLERIFKMSFASVYPLYVKKAERKGRTKDEVDEVIAWLTGYSGARLQRALDTQLDFETFFAKAPRLNPNVGLITGVVCGVRVEEIADPLMQKIRYLDKLIDELARGKKMASILRA